MVGEFALHRKLGSGSFASVYLGVSSADGRTAAIKAIKSERLTKKVKDNLDVEISILSSFSHPHIVQMFNVLKTSSHIYLVLEYCSGGDLQKLIRSRNSGRLTERVARRLMRDLCKGLQFLHSKDVIHRDIKPQNLLLTNPLPPDEFDDEAKPNSPVPNHDPSIPFQLKIADFGFARQLESAALAETLCGSPLYMAPEILSQHPYSSNADLWSTGTVLFEMIAGKPPFNGVNHIDLLRNIQRKAVRLPEGVRVTPECVALLRGLLQRDPKKRDGFPDFEAKCEAFVGLGCGDENTRRDAIARMQQQQHSATSSTGSFEVSSYTSPYKNSSSGGPHQIYATPPMTATPPPSHFTSPPPFSLAANSSSGSREQMHYSAQLAQQQLLAQQQHLQHQQAILAQQQQQLAAVYGVAPFPPLAPSPPMPRSVSRENLPVFRLDGSDNPSGKSDVNDGFVMVGGGGAGFYPPQVPGQGFPQYSPPGHMNMLSTSPGTGGALMAMMQQQQHQQQRQLPKNSLFPANAGSSGGAVSLGGVDLAAKMLQAAEDIARRAINVAHVGDVRAFTAMKYFVGEGGTSEDAPISANVSVGGSSSSGGEGKSSNESSRTSNNSMSAAPFGLELEEVQEENGGEGEDIPDAEPREDDQGKGEDDQEKDEMLSQAELSKPKTEGQSEEQSQGSKKLTAQGARKHLTEAVSLYFYSLRLMKGAITASQRVSDVVSSVSGGSSREGSPNVLESHQALLRRCKNSQKWLGTQFNGILERAEAGQGKLEAFKEKGGGGPVGEGEGDNALTATEVIYAAAIKNGREGHSKQIAGELHVSQTLFKTSGILCEALLMEEGLTERDIEVLNKLRVSVYKKVTEIEQIIG